MYDIYHAFLQVMIAYKLFATCGPYLDVLLCLEVNKYLISTLLSLE